MERILKLIIKKNILKIETFIHIDKIKNINIK